MEATTGSLDEKRHKLADPDRRAGLRDNLPATATAPIETVTVLVASHRGDRAVPGNVGAAGC